MLLKDILDPRYYFVYIFIVKFIILSTSMSCFSMYANVLLHVFAADEYYRTPFEGGVELKIITLSFHLFCNLNDNYGAY